METINQMQSFLQLENARGPESLRGWPDIVLWGAGPYVEKVLRWLGTDNVSAIYDNDPAKWGQNICDITVRAPEHFSVTPDTAVVISASSHIHEIANTLLETYGVPDHQIYPIITNWSAQHRYLPETISAHKTELEQVMTLLGDDASKKYFAGYMNTVLTMNPAHLVCNPKISAPYVYWGEKDQVVPARGDCIVDCGAYIGDTMELLARLAENDCTFFGIEPVLGNYQALCKASNHFPEIRPTAWQYALGEKPGQVKIVSEETITPRATVHGDYADERHTVTATVPVETLDRLFASRKVDYIKMDIEGEEVRALLGAKNIIARDHPTMMLSAYHLIEHLWEIPLLLYDLVPAYRIYCGHQPNALLEPEFYCIAR